MLSHEHAMFLSRWASPISDLQIIGNRVYFMLEKLLACIFSALHWSGKDVFCT